MLGAYLQGNFTFASEMILAIIELVTAVWLSLYMGWAAHGLRLMPRWANTLLACCGREYRDVYYEQEDPFAAKEAEQDALKEAEEGQVRTRTGERKESLPVWIACCRLGLWDFECEVCR